ncbi:hypothetical protein [Vibrio sp. SCSIO 43136]|uniref:hypothetical protein n=1 Tax=Vibrio sp. SCSIO 43136 TaxID=2819101 RepID=UPI00207515E2|nr:hypothetical protein [Vibrio sp. SCSIO 43136]USD65265.1 hypothetical protein J4N39_14665 [Vibrio sp. SCSIO 43136]
MSVSTQITRGAIFAACALAAAGALVFNAFPLYLSSIAQQFGLNDEQLGLLGSAYLGAFALVALFSPFWVKRTPWKLVSSIGYALMAIGSYGLTVTTADNVHLVMAAIGFGSGIVFTISLAILSAAHNPDKAYGWKLVLEMVSAGILVYVVTSIVQAQFGFAGFIWTVLAIYALSLVSLVNLPANFLAKEQASEKGSKLNLPALLASFALFFQAGTFAGLWGFVERIGSDMGIGSDLIGMTISGSILAGIGGALCCVAFGAKYSHRSLILSGLAISLVTLALLQWFPSTLTFIVAVCLINALLQFLIASLMALVTDNDQTGKYTVMMAFVLPMGGAIGPGVLGAIVEAYGFSMGYVWATLFIILTGVMVVASTSSAQSIQQGQLAAEEG